MKTALVALAVLATSVPAAGLACSCMELGGTNMTGPEEGQASVPLNTRIWVGGGITRGLRDGETQHPIELLDSEGVVLPGTETRLRGNWDLFDVFTPDFLLEPGATYTIRVNGEDQASFSTGVTEDTEAPAPPTVSERRTWSRPATPPDGFSCGDNSASHGFSLSFDQHLDSFLIITDGNDLADVDVDAIEGDVPSLSPFLNAAMGVGFGCGGDNWLDARNGAEATFRAGSYDLAGNFSGWSEDETIIVRPAPVTEGCSAVGPASPSLFALFLLGGVVLRRRE